MSEQQNRIASLLNSGSSSTTAPSTTTSSTTGTPTTGTPAPGTVTYDIRPGENATAAQLGINSTPDALISVDGHDVAAGDDGLSIDIAPDGSTHVTHGPQDVSQHPQPAGQYGQVPTNVPLQNGQAATDSSMDHGQGTATPVDYGQGSTGSSGQDGQTPTNTAPQDGQPPTADPTAYDQSQGGTQSPGDGSPLSGQYDQTGMPQDQTPVEHLNGIGDHAAQVDLALHGANPNLPAPTIQERADGGQDIVIPKGPDNPHAITLHVDPNKDGSFDLTIPKSDTNPHEVKIHVPPDKHVDLNVTQDKDGHIKIDAHDHPADQQGDWPGLQGVAGQNPGYGNGVPVPGQSDGPGQPADPGEQPGSGDAQTPQVPDFPTPQPADMPTGSGAPTNGGGGGAPTNGGGGGAPTNGGGGGAPTNGGGAPKNADKPGKTPPPQKKKPDGSLDVSESKIKDMGTKIEQGPAKTLATASQHATGINIGFPGFGALGNPIQAVYSSLSNSAASELQQGSTSLSSTAKAVVTTGGTYGESEDTANDLVNNTDITGG